jgi:hypothetical protein
MTRAVTRLTGLLTLGALTLGGIAASPAQARATTDRAGGFEGVLSWEGGVTQACWTPVGDSEAEVRVRWDGRRYGWANRGAGGLGRVSGSFAISDWTYSFSDAGTVGPVVSLTMARGGYVYLLVGSNVGITREVVVPVRTLSQCAGSRTEAAKHSGSMTGERDRAKRSCVSKKEFRKIRKGMTPARVKQVVGARGRKVTSAPYSLVQRYRKCTGSGSVVVNFQRPRETAPNTVVSRFR